MASRTQARQIAVDWLYAYYLGSTIDADSMQEDLKEQHISGAKAEFALSLYDGVVENIIVIDLAIQKYLKNWSLSRIGHLERAILRLGVYEICVNKLQIGIVANEMLELAKKFCEPKSVSFINGILQSVSKMEEDILTLGTKLEPEIILEPEIVEIEALEVPTQTAEETQTAEASK